MHGHKLLKWCVVKKQKTRSLPNKSSLIVKIFLWFSNKTRPDPAWVSKLTVLIEVNEVQREGSTLSHTPNWLQVLLIIAVVLGQRRGWMVPALVFGQKRNSVVSASHWPGAAHVCDKKEGWKRGEAKEFMPCSVWLRPVWLNISHLLLVVQLHKYCSI